MTIDILENQLQDQKEKHKEELQILEQIISEVDQNASSSDYLVNNNIKPNKVHLANLEKAYL